MKIYEQIIASMGPAGPIEKAIVIKIVPIIHIIPVIDPSIKTFHSKEF